VNKYVLDACALIAYFKKEAARLKALYDISFADSIALALAFVFGGTFVTADYHEFDTVGKKGSFKFC
jgi:predicted nucleic acid-binding protein